MYRNRLTRLIKIAERKYYADLLESNKSNLKKTWNILKTIINKKKVHKVNENFKLSDDSITSDKKELPYLVRPSFLLRRPPVHNFGGSDFDAAQCGLKALNSDFMTWDFAPFYG